MTGGEDRQNTYIEKKRVCTKRKKTGPTTSSRTTFPQRSPLSPLSSSTRRGEREPVRDRPRVTTPADVVPSAGPLPVVRRQGPLFPTLFRRAAEPDRPAADVSGRRTERSASVSIPISCRVTSCRIVSCRIVSYRCMPCFVYTGVKAIYYTRKTSPKTSL